MHIVKIFENQTTGKVKPMHAVNNGPVYKFGVDQRITNIDAFREAGIPYARTHDASFYPGYGGEHTVDVHAIFPNFDADPYDENSYDFACTDEYLRVIDYAGVKTFYRLGSKIEHTIKKYGTLPPKDFKKWAVICEHIIRHYNEGWANGFHYNIEYWEIWNEPDLDTDDSTHKRNWGGTRKQFFEFFDIAAKYLKECFPDLKIGGPAMAGGMREEFLAQLEAPIDFLSWHCYHWEIEHIVEWTHCYQGLLKKYGFSGAESILDEWNYVHSWVGDGFVKSIKDIKGIKGASFSSGVMCACQYEPVDMLMYYDARPCRFNGMFDTDIVCENLKGYYPFKMFNELYKKEAAVLVDTNESSNIYAAAAKSENSETSIMLTYYDFNEKEKFHDVEIRLCDSESSRTAEIYLLDDTHDMELVKTEIVDNKINLKMSLFSTALINLK